MYFALATKVATTGIPGLKPLPLTETPFVISCSATFSLILIDLVKYLLVKNTEIRW